MIFRKILFFLNYLSSHNNNKIPPKFIRFHLIQCLPHPNKFDFIFVLKKMKHFPNVAVTGDNKMIYKKHQFVSHEK
jgi:hypothetical protein